MAEVKSTKGIEKNMHSEIENLVHKAYEEGKEDGLKGAKVTDSCSWEKGVEDAWESIINMLRLMSTDDDMSTEDKIVFRALTHTFETTDHIDYTRTYVEVKNLDDEEDELEVGDVVLDPMNNECVITNIESHIHVIYPKNGKTHKWKKDTKFEQTGKHIIGVGKMEI